eukprot:gene6009-8278_t
MNYSLALLSNDNLGESFNSPKPSFSFECCPIVLGPLDYAIIALTIVCPQEVIYETDFLSMMESITICAKSSDGQDVKVSGNFYDENYISEHYLELPGGVVLLRDKPANSWRYLG